MPKNWYSIKAAANGSDVAEVNILDYIGAWGVNALDFLAEIRAVSASTIKVFINSPGGSVFEALAIFNGLRATKKNIEVHVLGVAASAASYIAMAGDKIVMPANTYLFIHNPINAVYGNAEEMRSMADVLDKIGASLTATYAKRWKGEASKLEELMAAESYLTAAECLEFGLCDEVTPEIMAEAAFDVDRLPEALRTVFHKAAEHAADPAPAPSATVHPDIADLITSSLKAAGLEAYTPEFVRDSKLTDKDTIEAAVRDAALIQKLAGLSNAADLGPQMIKARKTVDEARIELAAHQARLDEQTPINTAAPSKPAKAGDGISAGSIWADIHAMTNPTTRSVK